MKNSQAAQKEKLLIYIRFHADFALKKLLIAVTSLRMYINVSGHSEISTLCLLNIN